MSAKEYSCVKRTKRSFENSLAELSKQKPLNKITVKMLCEHAQLSRNAFYFHYKDINDLIEDIENSLVEEALGNFDNYKQLGFPKNIRVTIVALIEMVEEKKDLCKMLFENSDSFTERLSKAFCDFNYQYYVEYHGTKDRTSFDFFYMFISKGFYGLVKYWLDNPDKMSKNELVGLIYLLINRLLVKGSPNIDDTLKRGKKNGK